MKSFHRAFVSAIVLLSAVLCQQDFSEYNEVNCEYHQGGSICDCQYSSEVLINTFLSVLYCEIDSVRVCLRENLSRAP